MSVRITAYETHLRVNMQKGAAFWHVAIFLKKLQGFEDLRKTCHLFHGSHPIPFWKNDTKKRRRARATCFCQPLLGPKPTSVPTSHHSTRWLKPNGIERLKPSDHSANSSCSPPPHQKKTTRLWRCWWVLIGMRVFFKRKLWKRDPWQVNLVKSHNPTVERLTQDPFENKNLTWKSSQKGGQKWTKNVNIDFERPLPNPWNFQDFCNHHSEVQTQ